MTFHSNPETGKNRATESHDTEAPANLVSFMLKGWKPRKDDRKPVARLDTYRKRREALSRAFPGELLVIPTGNPKTRANDQFYRFRPGSDFWYLTGNAEPNAVLALIPEGKGHRTILFVEPNPGRTDATFFTDRVKGELWEGPGVRLGIEASREKFGVDECRGLETFSELCGAGGRLLRGLSDSVEKSWQKPASAADKELAERLSEMRLIKEPEEVKAISLAIDSTKRGFEDVIRRLKSAKSERELEGVFYTRARTEGNDVGYYSIVASGAHACTLHWKRNDGKLEKGDLLLLDAGVEGNSLYTSDITRTLPLSGKFSREQRAIYELVHQAQAAAFQEVRPGNDFMAPNRAAMQVLAHGLERLGILPMPAEEALRQENQFYRRYSLHNVSHMLGLDVHDCAQARAQNYKYGKLLEGMVLTIEPGLYFQIDDLTVPAKYRGIGIRIEDDVVVTRKSYKNLSAGIPSRAEDVEKWMKAVWKKA